ncbi:MAG: cell division protein SepF [Clostridiales bacterium]|nr:cell division protein SepF [Clostridiales bacterium]
MDNDFFENFLRNSSNYNGSLEYFEDTHDAYGNYIDPRYRQPTQGYAPTGAVQTGGAGQFAQSVPPMQPIQPPPQPQTPPPQEPKAKPLPTVEQAVAAQLNSKFVIYRPRTTADVEQLIAYLRRGEPALVDLDPISDSPDAQRLMDFTSGAAYALGDRVITVRRNLFLITPDTMDVLKPESED